MLKLNPTRLCSQYTEQPLVMIVLILFGVFVVTNSEQIINVPLGSVDTKVAVGHQVPDGSQPLEPDDVTASKNAMKWGNNLIDHATTGVPPTPILDPFFKKELPQISISHSLFSAKVDLENLKITGIKDIKLANTELRLKKKRFDVTLSGPAINAEVDYNIVVILGFLPVTYKGHVSVLINGVNLTAGASVTQKWNKDVPVFQLDGLEVAVHADDVSFTIDKTLWQSVTGIMSASAIRDQVATEIAKEVIIQVNLILNDYAATTVLQYLLGNGSIKRKSLHID